MDARAIAIFIPILAVGGFFAWMIALSPLGKALADRLRHGAVPPAPKDRFGQDELLEAVEALRQEVAELAERVDFTERLLARKQGGDRLSPPDRVSG